jgi:hypothetical protein
MAYIGKSEASIGNPRFAEFFVTTPGFLQSGNGASNYESMQLFFNGQKGATTTDPEAYGGSDESNLAWGEKIQMSYPLWSSDLVVFKNLQLLIAHGFNAFGKDENGRFYSFIPVANGDFFGTPDGMLESNLSGGGTKLSITSKERKIDFMARGFMFGATHKFLNTSMGAYIAVGSQVTGGTTRSLAQVTQARATRVLPPGFHTVTWGGADVGILEDASLELEFIGGDLQMNRQVIRQVRYTAKWKTKQFNATQSSAGVDNQLSDGTLNMSSYAGEVFSFVNARGKVKQQFLSNDWAYLEGEFTGLISITAIDWTAPQQPVFTLNSI